MDLQSIDFETDAINKEKQNEYTTDKATLWILLCDHLYPTMRTFGAPCIRCCWRNPDLAFRLSASWIFFRKHSF